MRSPIIYAVVFASGVAIGWIGCQFFSGKTALVSAPASVAAGEVTRLKDLSHVPTYESVLYANEHYRFELKYPRGFATKEFDEGNDRMTVVFQKPGEKQGFQLYVVPHPEKYLSNATILRDVPSGKIVDLKEETIKPGLVAATFSSEEPFAGPVREIWILHGGYLFEFTAYGTDDAWLKQILQTLEFSS